MFLKLKSDSLESPDSFSFLLKYFTLKVFPISRIISLKYAPQNGPSYFLEIGLAIDAKVLRPSTVANVALSFSKKFSS